MRRAVAWGLALALIVALAACGFMRWPLSAAKVGDSLNAAFGASPRLHWSAPQAASFSALPWPSVRIVDARLADAYGVNLLSAPAAGLNLSLIDLLRGRVIPTGVILVSPTVTVDVDHPPFAGAAGGLGGPASLARRALAPLASLRLSNGVLRLVSAKRGVDTLIDNVQGRFDGLTIGDQLRFNLSAIWRKTPIAVAGALDDPETAARGEPSPIVFGLDSPLAKLTFGGSLALGDKPSADGDLTASVPSIAALASFLNAKPPPVLAADDIAIIAKVKGAPNALTLGDATLTSAGQTLEGALAISDAAERPAVSGTLAAETLALGPLLGPPERIFDPSGGWSAKPFTLEPMRAFDLDLRLSAAHLDIYGLPLADAAASVIVKDGKLDMTLIEAAAYGGRLQGEAAARFGRDLQISARGELVDADLGAAIADFGPPFATGRGGARFDVEASGASPAAAIASLTGTASVEAADGSILGVNLEEALRRSRRRPIDVERDLRLGGTAFDKVDVLLALTDGSARVQRGVMTSHGVTAELGGLIDLVAQSWALNVNAVQTDAAGEESQDAAHLTLDIAGPWSAPTIRAIGDGSTDPVGDPPAH
ncbi:MAG TPA: AsmA-like C-terminal region-containing protein [Roseiarcus sp.]|jgi:AsmA protein|nr:AsmA-like C-terminal region-containing protein [Roseiarcus sp.]